MAILSDHILYLIVLCKYVLDNCIVEQPWMQRYPLVISILPSFEAMWLLSDYSKFYIL